MISLPGVSNPEDAETSPKNWISANCIELAAPAFLTPVKIIRYEVYEVVFVNSTIGPGVSRVAGNEIPPESIKVQFSPEPVLLSVLEITSSVP